MLLCMTGHGCPRRRPRPSTASPSRARRSPATRSCGARSAPTAARACSRTPAGARTACAAAHPRPQRTQSQTRLRRRPGRAQRLSHPHRVRVAVRHHRRRSTVTSSASRSSVKAQLSIDGSPFTNPLELQGAPTSRTAVEGDTVAIGCQYEPAVRRGVDRGRVRAAHRAPRACTRCASPVRTSPGWSASTDGLEPITVAERRHRGDGRHLHRAQPAEGVQRLRPRRARQRRHDALERPHHVHPRQPHARVSSRVTSGR